MAAVEERREDGVAILTLNRPDSRNALNVEMNVALGEALLRLAADPSVGCVLVTGAGKAFCAGGDVKGMAEKGGADAFGDTSFEGRVQTLRRGMEIAQLLYDMPKPTIAALPGAAAGAGLSLALACDLRIAASGIKLTTAFANVGLSGDYGGSFFLSHLVGAGKAKELYFMGDVILAEEAQALGLINRVVPAEKLEAEAIAWAKRLAAGPRLALSYIKRNLNLAAKRGLPDVMDQEAFFMVRCSQSDDHREAAQAFVERRAPVFKGA